MPGAATTLSTDLLHTHVNQQIQLGAEPMAAARSISSLIVRVVGTQLLRISDAAHKHRNHPTAGACLAAASYLRQGAVHLDSGQSNMSLTLEELGCKIRELDRGLQVSASGQAALQDASLIIGTVGRFLSEMKFLEQGATPLRIN